MNEPPLVLTQGALRDFAACPRRFQLRYLAHLPWPQSPVDAATAVAFNRGQTFHRLLERHFLGIPIDESSLTDDVLRGWWHAFARSDLALPQGRRWQEHVLTVPVDGHFLTGRFDLLIVAETQDGVRAHLYDWKTGPPQPTARLRQDWQTRLYLGMLAESGQALTESARPLAADGLMMTYWYTAEPDAPRTIAYSAAEHARNWAEIRELVAAIDRARAKDTWPLTADLAHCRYCAYQVHCDRRQTGFAPWADQEDDAEGLAIDESTFEPYTP